MSADDQPTDDELAELVHGPVLYEQRVPSTGGRLLVHEDGHHRYPPPAPTEPQ